MLALPFRFPPSSFRLICTSTDKRLKHYNILILARQYILPFMPFLAFLVILLSGAGVFLVFGWLLRVRQPRASLILFILAGGVGLLLFYLWLLDAAGWQQNSLYQRLSYGLRDTSIQQFARANPEPERLLFLFSLSSQALAGVAAEKAEYQNDAHGLLRWMAEWVADERRFPVWQQRGEWEQQAFFLAHACIVLGHYQQATLDEAYAQKWTQAAQFLANGLTHSRYKHLASRPRDIALRPYDNAAILYALQLHDRYFGSQLLGPALRDWSRYVERELQYDDTTLPCSGFTATNRCRLFSVSSSLAILTAYSAQVEAPISRDFWRELRHYYKENVLNLWATFRTVPEGNELPDFCDDSIAPLSCGLYQTELCQWAAASRHDWLTYYQLNNTLILRDIFGRPDLVGYQPPLRKVEAMIRLSARLCAANR